MRGMRVLVAPVHVVLDPGYGSEVAWVYNIIAGLAKRHNVWVDAICDDATKLGLPSNVKIHRANIDRWDLRSKMPFTLRVYERAKRLVDAVDLVHHMLPFYFGSGYNPLAVSGYLRSKPFIVGAYIIPQSILRYN